MSRRDQPNSDNTAELQGSTSTGHHQRVAPCSHNTCAIAHAHRARLGPPCVSGRTHCSPQFITHH